MKRTAVSAIVIAIGATVVGLAVVLGVVGPWRTPYVARPACSELPSGSAVDTAFADHRDLTAQIEAVGSGVHVTRTSPCSDQPDRAVVTITYRTSTERAKVDHILTTADGFGVPVELVED
jgi:hypothetical protein